jgi:hypothetical protein
LLRSCKNSVFSEIQEKSLKKLAAALDGGGVMNLPVLRCKRQTRCEVGAQSHRDSHGGVGRATTGVDRHHVASGDGALAQTIRTIGGH